MTPSTRRIQIPAERRLRPSDGRVAALNHALLVLPLLVTVFLAAEYYSAHQFAVDFHHDFWVAGLRVRAGLSPYDWTRQQIAGLASFPYPAPAAILFVPFSFLNRSLSDPLFAAMSLGAGLSALRILHVRDWRIYALVLLWWPVINAWQTANLTLLFVCGIAIVWRYRQVPAVAGIVTGLMLALKPVIWPLVLWLLITRRLRAVGYAVAVALTVNVAAWSVLGFGQLHAWWHLVTMQTDVLYREGYGLTALAVHFGANRAVGTLLQLVAIGLVVFACIRLVRHKRETQAFALAVVLMVVSSPLVDNHYFAFLIVPLAITEPWLSPAWAIGLLLWLCPATGVAAWQIAFAWATLAGATAWLLYGRPRSPVEFQGVRRSTFPTPEADGACSPDPGALLRTPI